MQRDYIVLVFGTGGITTGMQCLLLVHTVLESQWKKSEISWEQSRRWQIGKPNSERPKEFNLYSLSKGGLKGTWSYSFVPCEKKEVEDSLISIPEKGLIRDVGSKLYLKQFRLEGRTNLIFFPSFFFHY